MDWPRMQTNRLQFERPAEAAAVGVSFAPIVDIILQLICFYLFVAGSIQRYDDPAVQVPFMASPAAVEEQPAELVLNIRADGTLTVNDRPAEWDSLRGLLAAGLTGLRPVSVSVRVDRRQSFARLSQTLDVCRELGLERVAIRTTREGEP